MRVYESSRTEPQEVQYIALYGCLEAYHFPPSRTQSSPMLGTGIPTPQKLLLDGRQAQALGIERTGNQAQTDRTIRQVPT